MAWLSFLVWWQRPENQRGFWRTYKNGVAISLGETPRYIFRQILQRLKEYHDQNVGYGNLLQGMLIGENKQVFLANDGSIPNSPLEPLASIRQDFLDFKKLVTLVETIISTEQRVQPSYSSEKFHDLFTLLDDERYNSTVDGLRRFGFFIRNNPLFYDDAAKFLFFRKVLTILEYSETYFQTNVRLLDLRDWSKDVCNAHLVAVRDFRTKSSGNPTNQSGNPTSQNVGNSTSQSGTCKKKKSQSGNPISQSGGNPTSQSGMPKKKTSQSGNPTSQSGGNPTSQSGMRKKKPSRISYEEPDGSIVFFRNCLGHMREQNAGVQHYDDAEILLALEEDLPKVIPVWFYALVQQLDLDYLKCVGMCKHSWQEFLSMPPTVFS